MKQNKSDFDSPLFTGVIFLNMKTFFKYVLFLILVVGAFILGYLYSNNNAGDKTDEQNSESRVVIEDLEDRVISTVTHPLTGTVVSVIKGDKITRSWNDELSVPSVGYKTKVTIKKTNDPYNYEHTAFYYDNSFDPVVSGIQFSPNGKYVSFSVDVMGYKSSYLFNIDTYRNLIRTDEYIFDSKVEWSTDSQTANFRSKFTGEGGEGYDGNVKFDAKTDNFYKI